MIPTTTGCLDIGAVQRQEPNGAVDVLGEVT